MSKTDVASPVEKRRSQLLAEMTSATREVAKEFHGKLGTAARGVILVHYDVGKRVSDMVANEDTYGMNAVNQIAEFLSCQPMYLYSMKNVAEAFDRKFVESKTMKPMADGSFLTKQHWIEISKLTSASDREKMLKRTFANSLSSSDIEKEIQAGGSGKTKAHSRSGGKKPKSPTSAVAGLQKVFGLTQQWSNYMDVAEDAVFEAIDKMAPDSLNDAMLDRLKKTEEAAETLKEKADGFVKHVRKNIERVERVLKQRPAEANGDGKEPRLKPRSGGGMAGRKDKKSKKAKRKAGAA